jgi:glucosamine--fructose-6-phosphate aminotransferase (isomerizing)
MITATAAPSTVTLYKSKLQLKDSLVIGISQSGKSPDICEVMQMAKDNHAITVAIVNVVDSPLAKIADFVLPLHVGEEKAVAATKSYIGSLAALIQLTAIISNDQSLIKAMPALPDALYNAARQDWSAAFDLLKPATDALVLARGYGFPIAQEAALKLKETMSMHAEAFSAAEVLHGPFAVIKKDFPALMFAQNDVSLSGMLELSKKIMQIGGHTLLAAPENCIDKSASYASHILPLPKSVHPICDPLMCIQAFYPMAAQLAVARGKNPDAPDNLKKVTETR